ncbi:MAG TPA: hypothetical protein VI032_12010 [Burkholderiaceae bacterium]
MYPWIWIWAPQVRLPWSGDVVQDIDPSTTWFFKGIQPGAGNARIEEKAFAVASYGKQLGLLTEVLIELAEKSPDGGAACAESLKELKRIQAEIQKLKEAEYDHELREIEARITTVQRRGGKRSIALSKRLRGLAA